MSAKPPVDWEAIEREYRAGMLSLREIGRRHNVTEGAIRKRAKADGWVRQLADKVRTAVREKLVRDDGTHQPRATDEEIVEAAAEIGKQVQLTHRNDLRQLRAIGVILTTRLAAFLNGETPDGPFKGEKETPGDLFEKLARVKSRLIPLERQAHNLDAEPDAPVTVKVEADAAFGELVGALEGAARARARRAGGAGQVDQSGEA